MYDELGKRLRSLAGIIPQKHTLPSGADTVICSLEAFMQIKELAEEAADAIEELSKPRWIPVTEALPEEKQDGFSDDVLMLVENPDGDITWKDVYVGYYLYDATSAETGWWAMMTCDCVKIGEHKYGGKVFPANEYVTHWMPLPEPPKEET